MANEAASRDTVPNFRWGETSGGGSVSANVVEPPSGKKDTGWLPGADGIVGEYWNWLHWAARVAFRYLENVFGLGLPYNHVMTDAASTEGVITNGVGLSVNVASARCWIGGAMYVVPAATNLALAAADATHARIDLVYAHTTGSPAVPSYAVVTGTPAVSPATPSLPAGGCAIGTVQVNATATTPGTKTSVREFGAVQLDRVIARKRIDVGDISGTPGVTIRDTAGIVVGDPANPTFWAIGGDFVLLDPALFGFSGGASITRKFDISAAGFQQNGASVAHVPPASLSSRSGGAGAKWSGASTSNGVLADVRVPKGATITAFRIRGTRIDNTSGLKMELWKVAKADGAPTSLGNVNNLSSGSGGDFTLSVTGLSEIVDQDSVYSLEITWQGSDAVDLRNGEIEYTEINPFDSL